MGVITAIAIPRRKDCLAEWANDFDSSEMIPFQLEFWGYRGRSYTVDVT